jgi:hypothetical protein
VVKKVLVRTLVDRRWIRLLSVNKAEPTVVAEAGASTAPSPPVSVAAVEEGEAAMEATATQAALETTTDAGPSGEDVVAVLDEDSAPPLSSESRDVVMAPASELAQVTVTADPLTVVEVSEPSPAFGVSGPPLTAEAAETSLARVSLTVEEVMELAMCRYIDFLDVGVIDLEAPQLPEKVYEVVSERMFNEPTIMEMIASVSKALQEYERTGGFTPAIAAETVDAALEAPATHVEPTAYASTPPPAIESREASLPQSAEAAEAPTSVAEALAAEAIAEDEGSSPPRPVAADAGDVETRVLDEPAAATQELAASEMVTRAASPEIQEAEETRTSLSQGVVGGKAQTLELACTSWAATSGLGVDSEDDEEVAARNTLERGLTWARHAFDELILPATSVSFLVKD